MPGTTVAATPPGWRRTDASASGACSVSAAEDVLWEQKSVFETALEAIARRALPGAGPHLMVEGSVSVRGRGRVNPQTGKRAPAGSGSASSGRIAPMSSECSVATTRDSASSAAPFPAVSRCSSWRAPCRSRRLNERFEFLLNERGLGELWDRVVGGYSEWI